LLFLFCNRLRPSIRGGRLFPLLFLGKNRARFPLSAGLCLFFFRISIPLSPLLSPDSLDEYLLFFFFLSSSTITTGVGPFPFFFLVLVRSVTRSPAWSLHDHSVFSLPFPSCMRSFPFSPRRSGSSSFFGQPPPPQPPPPPPPQHPFPPSNEEHWFSRFHVHSGSSIFILPPPSPPESDRTVFFNGQATASLLFFSQL